MTQILFPRLLFRLLYLLIIENLIYFICHRNDTDYRNIYHLLLWNQHRDLQAGDNRTHLLKDKEILSDYRQLVYLSNERI